MAFQNFKRKAWASGDCRENSQQACPNWAVVGLRNCQGMQGGQTKEQGRDIADIGDGLRDEGRRV